MQKINEDLMKETLSLYICNILASKLFKVHHLEGGRGG